MVAAAVIGGTIAVVGSSAISASTQASAADKAAKTQAAAADRATQQQKQIYDENVARQQPFIAAGEQATGLLRSGTSSFDSPLLKPITVDQEFLESSPGYQFSLQQGLKATQNAVAARGLGISGAALKGAADFTTGLAANRYGDYFNQALAGQENQFNRLFSLASLGSGAAGTVGNQGVQTGSSIGSNIIGAGNAQAASTLYGANAFGTALTGAVDRGLGLAVLAGSQKGGLFGSEGKINPVTGARG